MIEVKLNETTFLNFETPVTVADIIREHKPDADLFLVDGHTVSPSFIITCDVDLLRVQKGAVPLEQELEHSRIGRHSEQGHRAMQKGTVGIAGLGGLGSNVAVALARMGVGRIVGVDYDLVMPSNINRQYYFIEQIGMKKTTALKSTIERINPFMKIDLHDIRITESNVKGIFDECDLIIEAFDKEKSKAMLFEAWQKYYPEKYYIGASGVAGYKDEPPLAIKKMGEHGFMIGDMVSEVATGHSLMAPRVGMAAHMQANLAVKFLVELNA